MNKKIKKIVCAFSLVFLITLVGNVFAENKLLFQEEIAPGVVRYKYTVEKKSKNAQANVVKVDLNNPYIKINTVAGAGTYTNKATVTQMANRTNAVALVNGDFFTMNLQGAPMGASVINGEIKSSPAVLTDIWSFGIDSNNNAHIEITNFAGKVTAPNGNSYPIDGLNKTYYWYQPSKEYSHESKIQMYDSFWSSKSRGDKTAGEVLLSKDNVVEQIQFRKNIDMKIPEGKKVLQVSGGSERFIQQNVKVGDKLKIETNINPNRNWKMMIGGHALLVQNGAVKNYTKDTASLGGVRARTAVGVSKDKQTVFIVTTEGRTNRSSGMSLRELSQFMLDLGCDIALNLDGGGSTAMSVRNLGDINRTRVTNPEKNAGERKVVNGLGVFNTTKNTGVIVNGKVEGNLNTIVGETSEYKLKSAWDEYLNPIDIKNRNYSLSENSNGANILNGTLYTALTPGKFNLTVTTDKGESFNKEINVADASAYNNIKITPSTQIIKNGSNIKLKAIGEFNGRKINISPKIINISFEDINANINPSDSSINIISYGENPKIIAKIGEKTSTLRLFDENSKFIKMKVNDVNYSINGEAKKMDAKPFISNSRTLVPIRFIIEAIGGEVNWNNDSRLVTINYNGNIIELPIDSKIIKINESNLEIDQASIIKGDRTYVPIRFVAENLGMNVNYIDETREIEIISKADNSSSEKDVIEESIIEYKEQSERNNNKNSNNNINNNKNSKNDNNINSNKE
ncbi:phosphodiester glycosidase family protein [Peptoniphilus sp. MSJ-1]|uniref:Phosphodiester glycosidase family protein n=1 Tax=Peptoniphilus ovalis TaxID=2841503 RepID=A0ABS6FFN6_9FIRM|nr:stalk domain-containing protein [Peptoniphilus ovalis]MBU5668982.1 phosphodiester glycosidase family protein [Peptoniphilus ovalis]